jgi:hypothetical protein
MVDIERLDRALAQIEAHPELHRQEEWLIKLDCGTGGCLAGWVVMQEYPDAKPAVDAEDPLSAYRNTERYGVVTFDSVRLPDGRLLNVADEASRLLGLKVELDQEELFDSVHTLAALRVMRDALAADPETTGDDLSEAVWVWVAQEAENRSRSEQ